MTKRDCSAIGVFCGNAGALRRLFPARQPPRLHKSGYLPRFLRFTIIGREECNRFICRNKTVFSLHFSALKTALPAARSICCTLSLDLGKSIFDFGGEPVTDDEKTAWGVKQLVSKQRELGRLPKKDDFDEVTRSRIKAFLGPWPRALESAGLKPPRLRSSTVRAAKGSAGVKKK